jgi:phosphatidylserine/phosphatidylglycerophosphate/cardiolipin synthase-like enzyme
MYKKAVLVILFIFLAGCTQNTECFTGFDAKAYFCPSHDCEAVLLKEINSAEKSIDIALYSFTLDSAGDALLSAGLRGVKIRVILEGDGSKSSYSEFQKLKNAGIPVRLDTGRGLMHHKFAVFDGSRVLTGSFNWSKNAVLNNNENIVIIKSEKLAEEYTEEFEKLFQEGATN